MRRLTLSLLLAAFVLLPLQNALAHGGGLNSDGCHNETATGGYHCHRHQENDDVDWALIGGIVGGLVLVRVIYKSWEPDHRTSHLGFSPELAADQDGNAYAGARLRVSW